MSDGPADPQPPDEQPRIRRSSNGGTPSTPMPAVAEPQTTIIRRHPTGEFPVITEDTRTAYIPRAKPVAIGRRPVATPKAAVITAVLAILSGWATAVIATSLITGWWRSDRLFCVAVGFLAAISAAATISGLIALLLRRRTGRLLVVVGSVVSLLIFSSLFVAGAKLPPLVYAIPVLPVASILFALLPATRRWARTT